MSVAHLWPAHHTLVMLAAADWVRDLSRSEAALGGTQDNCMAHTRSRSEDIALSNAACCAVALDARRLLLKKHVELGATQVGIIGKAELSLIRLFNSPMLIERPVHCKLQEVHLASWAAQLIQQRFICYLRLRAGAGPE